MKLACQLGATACLVAVTSVCWGGAAIMSATSGQSAGRGAPAALEAAIFAGGCFWCVEEAFDKIEGVVSTTSGYTGGRVSNPTYQQVSSGGTGHVEAVRIVFDPARVSYEALLEVFWRNIDPTDGGGQFCDRGEQYRSAIFYVNDDQRARAEAAKRALDSSGRSPRPIATEVVPAAEFYPAEDYHQDYYKKNPLQYRFYKWGCGRARRLEAVWGATK